MAKSKKKNKKKRSLKQKAEAKALKKVKQDKEKVTKKTSKLNRYILIGFSVWIGATFLLFTGLVAWKLIWQALTPNTLFRYLPGQTVIASEQYLASNLPQVRQAQELIGQKNYWAFSDYPEEITVQISQLKPIRVLQSWQAFDGQLLPLIIVETSDHNQRTKDNAIQQISAGDSTWYLQQFQPGYYSLASHEAVLLGPSNEALAYNKDFREAQQNLPQEYYASFYLQPELLSPFITLDSQTIYGQLADQVVAQLGPSLFTLVATNGQLKLIGYTNPSQLRSTFPSNHLQYEFNLANLITGEPDLITGGNELGYRLLSLIAPPASQKSLPLETQFEQITNGLDLPDDSFQILNELLNKEFLYLHYSDNAQAFILDDVTPELFEQVYLIALKINNYYNPQTVTYQLRDGTTGRKLLPGTKTELPLTTNNWNYFKAGTQTIYLLYDAPASQLLLGDNLEQLESHFAEKPKLDYQSKMEALLTNADELSYISGEQIPAFVQELLQLESVTISKNFFTDGIQTNFNLELANHARNE